MVCVCVCVWLLSVTISGLLLWFWKGDLSPEFAYQCAISTYSVPVLFDTFVSIGMPPLLMQSSVHLVYVCVCVGG